MEEQMVSAVNVAIDAAQVVVIPLAVAGLCAWVSPFVSDSKLRFAMKVINVVGGNVKKAKNQGGN